MHQQSKVPEVALQILNAISAAALDYPDTLAATVEAAWKIIELRHLKSCKRAVVRPSKPDAAAAIASPTEIRPRHGPIIHTGHRLDR